MIRVNWYFSTGMASHSHDFATVQEAYARLVMSGMDALVFPAHTNAGVYRWDRHDSRHTLEALTAKMERIQLEASK